MTQRHKLKQRFENRRYVYHLLLDSECAVCGEKDPACLEFDHNDPATKRGSVSELAHQGVPIRVLRQEISKCTVVCANCHRKKTARDQNWYADLVS